MHPMDQILLGNLIHFGKHYIAHEGDYCAAEKTTEMGLKSGLRLQEVLAWPLAILVHLLAHLCKLLMKPTPTFNNWQSSPTQMHFDTT